MKRASQERHIQTYYGVLSRNFGHQNWWPARTSLEVVVGAFLTQNTAWVNVESALRALRAHQLLSLHAIREAPLQRLELLIRPAGYFRQKARGLKGFVSFVDVHYAGSLARMFAQPTEKLRGQLLSLEGIGPETADSVLLYAGQHPVFVVDAYARRVLERHAVVPTSASYEEIRALCERALASESLNLTELKTDSLELFAKPSPSPHKPSRMSRANRSSLAQVYNEAHALFVTLGKHYCLKSKPRCEQCPLGSFLPRRSCHLRVSGKDVGLMKSRS